MQEVTKEIVPEPIEKAEIQTLAPTDSRVLKFPHPALLGRAFTVDSVNDNVREIAADLVAVMKREDGVGLAAPQIGMNLRIIAVSAGPGAEPAVLCDPVILNRKGQEWGVEACLSVPGVTARVMRASWISVTALDLNDQVVRFEATGMYARCIQHEIDHLDGVLLIHRLGPADRARARRTLEQLAADFAIANGAEAKTIRGANQKKMLDYVVSVAKKQAVYAE